MHRKAARLTLLVVAALACMAIFAPAQAAAVVCGDPGAITDTNSDNQINATDGVTAGPDYIQGDASNETINGGDGDDFICGGGGADTIHGDDGNDLIFGENGNDDEFGDADDDGFNPGLNDSGADEYDGGTGGDRVFYDADPSTVNNQVFPGDGANDGNPAANAGNGELDDVKASTEHVDFGPGSDFFQDYFAGVGTDNTVRGGDGIDTLLGGDGKDLLLGQGGDSENLQGGDGNDKVNAGPGAGHAVFGGLGSDHVYGGDDPAVGDIVAGEFGGSTGADGNDLVYGREGPDSLYGDKGDDRLYGGDGDDGLAGDANASNTGNDSLFGEAGADSLQGDNGNDQLAPGDDTDTDSPLDGGAGTDRAVYSEHSDNLVLSIASTTDGSDLNDDGDAADTGIGEDNEQILNNVENIASGSGDDFLRGNAAVNRLQGNDGADEIRGLGGADTELGNEGDDLLVGNDDGVTPVKDFLYCDGGLADHFLEDTLDFLHQCEVDDSPNPPS